MKAADGKDPIPHDRGLKSGHLAPHFAAARLARSLRSWKSSRTARQELTPGGSREGRTRRPGVISRRYDHALRDSWHEFAKEQVRHRREGEISIGLADETTSAKVADLFQRGSAGKWRGSGSCPSIEPPRTRLSPRMEKNGLAQILRNAPAQILYVARSASFLPALMSLNLRFLQRLDPT